MNSQPARHVFVRTREAKERRLPALLESNVEKTKLAPVSVIVASDARFYDQLPHQFAEFDARSIYVGNPALAEESALRNASLQGACLILATRALGLACGPVGGFDAAKLNGAFFPDGRWRVNFLVNPGYGDPAHKHPRGPRLPFGTAARLM